MASRTASRKPWTCINCRLSLSQSHQFNPIRTRRLPTFISQISAPFSTLPPRSNRHPEAIHEPPPQAPKPAVNLRLIRQYAEYHAQNCKNRNCSDLSSAPARIVSLYEEWASLQTSLRSERARHNSLSGRLRAASPLKTSPGVDGKEGQAETREGLLAEARELKVKITEVESREQALEATMKELALQIPNITHPNTPIGTTPKVLEHINSHLLPIDPDSLTPTSSPTGSTTTSVTTAPEVKSHAQIGAELSLLNFSAASLVSGWGWYYLLNEAVLLEQALINYSLSVALKSGWKLVTPPSIVYSHIASACGFRPRDQHGEQQTYTLEQSNSSAAANKPQLCLAGTAEIPLAGMHASRTFPEDDLPHKVIGISRSYRAEAGARGVESKGLYRVHEFTKVEMFAWTLPDHHPEAPSSSSPISSSFSTPPPPPDNSPAEATFTEMLNLQTTILTSLNLPLRILEQPSTDLGASASRKVDIEAYMPSRHNTSGGVWGEVSSLSNCLDYQSRRLNTRVKYNSSNSNCSTGGQPKKTEFPYTLNGTAMAVPRVLMAILENGWTEEGGGGVVVPEVLRGWMGGVDVIRRKH